MDLLQNIQNLLGEVERTNTANSRTSQTNAPLNLENLANQAAGYLNKENLSKLLGPTALGGLAGVLLGSKGGRNLAQKALVLGGGAALGAFALDRYRKMMQDANPAQSAFANQAVSPLDERAKRLILALVFAAKADGSMDSSEHQAIEQKMKELSFGPEAEAWVKEAMSMPLDPEQVAQGVQNQDEALELYVLSCSVITPDHFMERSYLDALAKALKIPDNVKQAIETDAATQRKQQA